MREERYTMNMDVHKLVREKNACVDAWIDKAIDE